MTPEEKELLIKDLCSRLPYECIVSIAEGGIDGIKWADLTLNSYLFYQIMEEDAWEYVKPYLRPMSSMTEEERGEIGEVIKRDYIEPYGEIKSSGVDNLLLSVCKSTANLQDFLYRKGFDIRGLISMGLALEANEGMYKN